MQTIRFFFLFFFVASGSLSPAQTNPAKTISANPGVYQVKPLTIETRWTEEVSPTNALKEYPRPQMVRSKWTNLNGLWNYAVTTKNEILPHKYDGKILVPYPIESALSGVKKSLQPDQLLWYKKNIVKPLAKAGEKVLLHFGAVDYESTVYLNGKEVGNHKGGYQNFSFDITRSLKAGSNELSVKVWDPSDKGENPHGKQVLEPGGIMYTPSSGIWQTVWMEVVPEVSIQSLKMRPDIDKEILNLSVDINGDKDEHDTSNYSIHVFVNDQFVGKGYDETDFENKLVVPVKRPHLWSPDDPYLYNLKVRLYRSGKLVDEVRSYFGMRKVEIKKDDSGTERISLNNKYTYNLGTLDQGFWPDGLYTAPTDEALAFDVKAIKAMGFNTIRKHIKIEPARWYYHCDNLGMLVWQDMVNPSNDSKEAREQFEKENKENIDQLYNYPSIIMWVLFNEGWGAYDQARLTQWVKDTDPSRLVNGHTGENYFSKSPEKVDEKWLSSDVTDIHAYPPPGIPPYLNGKVRVLGEFGGIGTSVDGHLWDDVAAGWGYGDKVNPAGMQARYEVMIDSLIHLEKAGLSGSIYTQPFDVEAEQNGLMTYDRAIIKLQLDTIAAINRRLWPITKNYKTATKEFSAKVAARTPTAYAERLAAYKTGRREPSFLRQLALMAAGEKDKENLQLIARHYIKTIKDPWTEQNMKFIAKFTYGSTDPGYPFLLKNLPKVLDITKSKAANYVVQGIIYKEEVKALINENPDWDKVATIIKKYPTITGEFIYGSAVIEYLNAIAQNKPSGTTKNLVAAATLYDDQFNDGAYNTWAWMLFQKSNNKEELTKALAWSRKSIDITPTDTREYPGCLDTYANLLYKLGNKGDALIWQSKALQYAPDNEEMKSNLEKMKAGTPTW